MLPYPHIPGQMQVMQTYLPTGCVIAFAGNPYLTAPTATPPPSPTVNPAQQASYTTIVESQGWMVCDGRQLVQGMYGALFAVLGTQYNIPGDDNTTVFRVPDYRGYFLRMVDMDSGNDPDAATRVLPDGTKGPNIGSVEQDALQYHLHPYTQPDPPASITLGTSGAATAVPNNQTQADTLEPIADSTKTPPPPAQYPSTPPPDYSTIKTSFETRPKNVYVYYLIKFV